VVVGSSVICSPSAPLAITKIKTIGKEMMYKRIDQMIRERKLI